MRLPPRKVSYRYYGNFVENDFLVDLSVNITSSFIDDYELFEKKFIETLDRHASRKTKLIRVNEKPHMNKALRKAIMIRSRLRNIYIRSRRLTDLHAYRKQRNYVCSLNIKTRRIYFDTIASNPSKSKHHFWSVCKPFFSDKQNVSEKILFVYKKEIISSDSVTASIFKTYFSNITKDLDLKVWESHSAQNSPSGDPFY